MLAAFFLHYPAAAQQYPYKFRYLTVEEGLSHTDVNDITQDKQGFIWIATLYGLNRYDGYTLKKYYNYSKPSINAFKNRIKCMYPDETGNLWLGTENGIQRFDPRTERYTNFDDLQSINTPFEKLVKPTARLLCGLAGGRLRLFAITADTLQEVQVQAPAGLFFSDMAADGKGLLYLSSNKGLWALDNNRLLKQLVVQGMPDQPLAVVCFGNRRQLLTATCNQVFLVNQAMQAGVAGTLTVTRQYAFTGNCIKGIVEGNQSDYWITVGDDLLHLNENTGLIQPLDNRRSLGNLNSRSLARLFVDRSQCLWVCTFGGGINYCDLNEKLFYTLQHDPEISNTLSGNHIRSVVEDGNQLWIGTTQNGLNRYDLHTRQYQYYNTRNSAVKLRSDKVTALAVDNEKNVWIGSIAGIEVLKKGGRELWKPAGSDQFPTYSISTMVKDCYGNIWFGNLHKNFGVIWKDKQNTYHVRYYDDGHFLFSDQKSPMLLIGSTQGLKQVMIDKEGNISKTIRYRSSPGGGGLSSDYVCPIVKQNDSVYWAGTLGGGLNRLSRKPGSDSFFIQPYKGNAGIFTDVEALEMDRAGNIWIGGNGLECLNPVTGKLVKYDKNDGLQGNSFKVGSSTEGADGRLYFGGVNGLNIFYPEQILPNPVNAQPVLTDILINNQRPVYGDTSGCSLPATISFARRLSLTHLQNNFVISFSSMHFANPLKCRYRYQLKGFDKEWKYTDGKNPGVAYSNLDYADYQFLVEATNSDGNWSPLQATIAIRLTPPWWKSDWAKLVYGLLVAAALAGMYIYQARWYRLKRELAVRAVNEKKQEELHKQREGFYQQQLTIFTNISHELRTPLSLILGPLEQLMSLNKNAGLDSSFRLMHRNTRRLINLISELMNVRKVADKVISLQVQPLAMHTFFSDIAAEFGNMAKSRDISFVFTDHMEDAAAADATGLFDAQVLEKILFNLLNNAIKYTHNGGQVSLEIFSKSTLKETAFANRFELLNQHTRASRYLYICVTDSGIGISAESLPKIFDRYYRVSNEHLGSGVGLALVKSLTELHKGDIYVSSERHKGTEIIIGLPWGDEYYSEAERAVSPVRAGSQLEKVAHEIPLPHADALQEQHPALSRIRKNILMVDDNYELRLFLKGALQEHYFVHEANDGLAALEMAARVVPDLIISDVMMPRMNGIELCKRIKEEFATSHIPFIILSAKETVMNQVEGMKSGADFYFGKPLSIDLLLLTVHNIFEQDKKLKQRYTSNYLSEATELVHTEKDKIFVQQLLKIIEHNIENPELDVDFLCEHLYVSRTNLYQKIKGISDQSVAEFIRAIRLKKAIQIMTFETVSMNEVADRIGMQSSSNFSRVFKKEYGQSPVKYMQCLRKNVLKT